MRTVQRDKGKKICCVRRKVAEPDEAARIFVWVTQKEGMAHGPCSSDAYDPNTLKLLLALARNGRRDEGEIKDAAVKVINHNEMLAGRSSLRQ